MTLEKIKLYVNKKFNIDIEEKTNKRKFVYPRVIYANLALKFIPKISLSEIGKSINKHHATIIDYRDNIINVIRENEPEIYKVYLDFIIINATNVNNEDVIEKYIELYLLYNDLKLKIKENNNSESERFNTILKSVPDDKLDLFYTRIKPIAKMLNSHIIQ